MPITILHFVLDQDHCDATIPDAADELHQLDRLGGIHTGGRLIEQENTARR